MAQTIRIPITNWLTRNVFTAQASVGNAAAPINVLLDTGSSMFVISGTMYDATKDPSATTTPLLQTENFQTQTLFASVVHASIGLGANGTTILDYLPNTNLAVVYNTPGGFGKASGVLGLAYPALNTAYTMPADTTRTHYPNQTQGHAAPNLDTYLTQLVKAGRIIDKFAFSVQRSRASQALDDPATDPVNSGVFVLGGGEECTDLYSGPFQSIAVLHNVYYNTNLIAVEVGTQTIPAPQPPAGSTAVSNSFVDSGNNTLSLEPGLYNQVIAALNQAGVGFGDTLRNPSGCDQTRLDLTKWPPLGLVLQGTDGSRVTLTVQPEDYWQFDAYGEGTALSVVSPAGGPQPGQSILGLPLFAGHYVVFDRTGARTAIRFASHPAVPLTA